jgi:malonyl-CoA O-methyltransferase
MSDTNPHPAAQPPALDALDPAWQRWARERALAPSLPWLHTEVASRMAERLPFFRLAPSTVLAWGRVGGGAEALRQAFPSARVQLVVGPEAAEVDAPPATPAAADGGDRRDGAGIQTAAPALTPSKWAFWRRRSSAADAAPNGDVSSPDARSVHVDALPPSGAQMLWANMALHALPDVAGVLSTWHRLLADEGLLMFSTLGPDTLRELRELFGEQGWGAPMKPFTDMHDLGDALVHAGFADPVMDQEVLRLQWTDPEALLRELRTLGRNTATERFAGLRTRRWRESLLQALRERANAQGRIELSFEVVYGHAFKVTRPVGGETAVDVDTLRAAMPSRRRRR